jgi:Tfp pilus assembly protein PilX
MNNYKGRNRELRDGAVLIIAVIFVALFSSLGLAILSMSSSNVQIADNHYKANRALESAQSGLEVTRYWLGRVAMPGTVTPADRFTTMTTLFNAELTTANISTTTPSAYDEDGACAVNLGSTTINSQTDQSFDASIEKTADLDVVKVTVTGGDITGGTDSITRTISVNCRFETREHNVFDYGVATKGPLNLLGNIAMDGTNVAVEADVYIESNSQNEALSIIGNSQIAGDVTITNPDGYVTLQGGQAGIGGETGLDALNHVSVGDAPVEFPVPLTDYFEQYVENTFDPAIHDTTSDATYENIRIPGGTNPTFSGNTSLSGIVFIESPNIVTFTGNADITGVIVGDGDMNDNSGENQIIFLGTVSSAPVSTLPETEQFDGIRNETGTFLMAPGFSASFGGNFDTLSGAIAANGINFFGNAGGTINGSIINYSDNPMMLGGDSNLYFNRSSDTEVPAGFGPELILNYISDSYSEVCG